MSQYANYADSSQDYDTTRIVVGVETILASLARTGIPLPKQIVLEAGCGTGNYLHAIRPHVGKIVGADCNEGMLAQARAKLGVDVELCCGDICDLPFEDQTFDGISCNQVLHHLDAGPGKTDDPATWGPHRFPKVTRFVEEAYRLLRPGGALVINASSHDQLCHGFWWAELIPQAVARLRCRAPDLDRLSEILAATGFEIESVAADFDGVLQGASYLHPEGPLQEAWRSGDSTWSLTMDAELAEATRRVEQLNATGAMQAYFDRREASRREYGQTTFICGRK